MLAPKRAALTCVFKTFARVSGPARSKPRAIRSGTRIRGIITRGVSARREFQGLGPAAAPLNACLRWLCKAVRCYAKPSLASVRFAPSGRESGISGPGVGIYLSPLCPRRGSSYSLFHPRGLPARLRSRGRGGAGKGAGLRAGEEGRRAGRKGGAEWGEGRGRSARAGRGCGL